MAAEDLLVIGKARREVDRDGLERMPGDPLARGVIHQVEDEEVLVVDARLDDDDVYIGVSVTRHLEFLL
jgi:hypothetical protein